MHFSPSRGVPSSLYHLHSTNVCVFDLSTASKRNVATNVHIYDEMCLVHILNHVLIQLLLLKLSLYRT